VIKRTMEILCFVLVLWELGSVAVVVVDYFSFAGFVCVRCRILFVCRTAVRFAFDVGLSWKISSVIGKLLV